MRDEYKTKNPKLRKAMLKVFGGKCFYTGQPVTAETMVIDHVVPKAKGGKDSIFNYVLTHQFLNSQKRDVLDEEKIKPILYLIKTVYAPRIIKIIHNKKKQVDEIYEYFVDLGYSKEKIKDKQELMQITGAPKEFVSVYAGFIIEGYGDPLDKMDEFSNLEEIALCEELLLRYSKSIKKNKKRIEKAMSKKGEVFTKERQETIDHWRKQLIKDRFEYQTTDGYTQTEIDMLNRCSSKNTKPGLHSDLSL